MTYPSFPPECRSLLCKYLTPEVFEALRDRKTPHGFTLAQAINSGVVNPDSSIGVYAGDEESYTVFAPLFDPIIEEYHGFGKAQKHRSDLDPGHLNASNPDPEGAFILSTRIRVGRNVAAMPLGPAISRAQRNEVEAMVSEALECLSGELEGTYYPLSGMRKSVQERLIKDHFLFKEGDRFLEAAGLNRDWPEGRGIYHNRDKTFLVWVNEEDHTRVISMQKGGNIREVFIRFCNGLNKVEALIKEAGHVFMWNEHLGFVLTCPSNLGTGLRAGVHLKIPMLSKDEKKLDSILEKLRLQKRGTGGVDTASVGGIYDMSNADRLGFSEVELVQAMVDGVGLLITMEKKLEKGEGIEDLMPK